MRTAHLLTVSASVATRCQHKLEWVGPQVNNFGNLMSLAREVKSTGDFRVGMMSDVQGPGLGEVRLIPDVEGVGNRGCG